MRHLAFLIASAPALAAAAPTWVMFPDKGFERSALGAALEAR